MTGHPLQVYPSRAPTEFKSLDDYVGYVEAVNRHNNGLLPPRPKPPADEIRTAVPTPESPRSVARLRYLKSEHVGIRLTRSDFKLLEELSQAHAVPVGTMARMLVVRGVRAAADAAD